MSSKKVLDNLIDYEEGLLSPQEIQEIEQQLEEDPDLQASQAHFQTLKRALKQQDWAEGPRDPKALTQKILSRLPGEKGIRFLFTPSKKDSFPQRILSAVKRKRIPFSQLGWAAAAAVLVIAIVFRWQWMRSNDALEALLTNQANEQMLYQVAKITLQQAQNPENAKLELSELLMGEDEYDVISVIEERGAESVGSQIMNLPQKAKTKSIFIKE